MNPNRARGREEGIRLRTLTMTPTDSQRPPSTCNAALSGVRACAAPSSMYDSMMGKTAALSCVV